MHQRWTRYLDRQHEQPTGLIGELVAVRMRRQHAPETAWSVELLDVQPGDHVLEIGFARAAA